MMSCKRLQAALILGGRAANFVTQLPDVWTIGLRLECVHVGARAVKWRQHAGSFQCPIVTAQTCFMFGWLRLPSLHTAEYERREMCTPKGFNTHHMTRQLTTRNHIRLNYASPAGPSMDSVTGTEMDVYKVV